MKNSVSFFCTVCDTDFDLEEGEGQANCHFDTLLRTKEKYIWGRCMKCGSKVTRYVTEMKNDPYFYRSKKLQKQRQQLRRELIQPGSPGFKTLYPEAWRQIEQATEKHHAKDEAEKKSRLEFYKKYRHTKEEESMRAFLRAEEK